jgi:hypothetical protein
MDNFDLRKFLAESKQPIQEMDAPMEVEAPMEGETMEEMVAEYVTEALKGENADAVYEIIEARCNRAAMEMKMEVVAEILEAYDGRINELEENAVFKEMLDETKMSNIKEIRESLYEMAAELKETYKETYMPEAEVEEGEEAVEEGTTIDGSSVKIVKGPIGAPKFTNALKAQKNLPTPPPLPPNVIDAVKAYVNDPKSSFKDFGTGNDSTATKASQALASYVLQNKKLADADKGYYVNQFNTMVMSKKKGKPAPPPLPSKE